MRKQIEDGDVAAGERVQIGQNGGLSQQDCRGIRTIVLVFAAAVQL